MSKDLDNLDFPKWVNKRHNDIKKDEALSLPEFMNKKNKQQKNKDLSKENYKLPKSVYITKVEKAKEKTIEKKKRIIKRTILLLLVTYLLTVKAISFQALVQKNDLTADDYEYVHQHGFFLTEEGKEKFPSAADQWYAFFENLNPKTLIETAEELKKGGL